MNDNWLQWIFDGFVAIMGGAIVALWHRLNGVHKEVHESQTKIAVMEAQWIDPVEQARLIADLTNAIQNLSKSVGEHNELFAEIKRTLVAIDSRIQHMERIMDMASQKEEQKWTSHSSTQSVGR